MNNNPNRRKRTPKRETWQEHIDKIIRQLSDSLKLSENVSIMDIIYYWKNCKAGTFPIYLEIEGKDSYFIKINKKDVTLGRMNSTLPIDIFQKIKSWFTGIDENSLYNRHISKASIGIYSNSKNYIWPFMKSISNNTKYTIEEVYSDGHNNFYIRLKEIDH